MNSTPGQRLINAANEEREKWRAPGSEAPVSARMIERIARSLCSARCAYRGVTPCWSSHTDRADAMEWPNPHCNDPGCHSMAADVYADVVPGSGRRR